MTGRFRSLIYSVVIATGLAAGVVGPFADSARAEKCVGERGGEHESSVYADCAPGWEVMARDFPTNLAPGHAGVINIEAFDVGAGSSETVTVTDILPKGVTAIEAGDAVLELEFATNPEGFILPHKSWACTGNGPGEVPGVDGATVVTCTNPGGVLGGAGNPEQLQVRIRAAAGAAEDPDDPGENHVIVGGGGAPSTASTSDPIAISSTAAPFEFTNFGVWFSNADGTLDTQAGSHPYAAMFNFDLSTILTKEGELSNGENETRDIEILTPPGFVGDPAALPQCSRAKFLVGRCPDASQIGIIRVETLSFPAILQVFNLVPPPGVPADFGFTLGGINTFVEASVRSGSDYGITAHINNTPQKIVQGADTILWGVPGDQTHDRWHSGNDDGCTPEEIEQSGNQCSTVGHPVVTPFLTLPTACGAPLKFTIRATSWQHPQQPAIERSVYWDDGNEEPTGITGCESLDFGPTFTTSPDTTRADAPAGLTVDVRSPVGGLEDPTDLGTADIKNTTVSLPEGFVINPGQAAGLQACQPGDVEGGDDLPLPGENGAEERFAGAARCPTASKVGEVEIATPLLIHALRGGVYVLQSNPPELKLLVAASGEGVNLKLVGIVHLNETTGRLTTTFSETPELPFTDFKLSFSGGAQAALVTPAQCGTYETTSDFTPWSTPFVTDVFPSASFGVSEGPGGGACPSSPLPFSPSLTAGSTTDQAGGSTGFTMLLSRGDGQQRIEKLQFEIPPGLSGIISSVPLCGEPQAAQGTCPASSHVGHTVVTSGPGPYPLVIPQPGEPEAAIYLTGPYKGAPFGLSIVTPVIAGPFNLGTIVTRAKIEVDPRTAQITVTTDPLPQVVDGVPTDLRSVYAVIDRPGFMINPTNCEPSSFSGTAWGTPPPGAGGPGATAAISSHFGVGSCRSLEFKPKVAVATKGRASKANGAALTFKISYPKGARGSEAWFDEAKFDIPKQLPARLSTLQQACLAATFETNRAACPKASVIGHAIVHTPVLPVPLEGSVYFVSYGATKFPDAVLDLHGDNVHVELHGETFISKTSVTSATFRNTPDVPFESIEVNVPMGPYSEFGANLPAKDNYDYCGQKLKMPTFFKAQNGLEIHQETPVTITGCPKPKKAKKVAKQHTNAARQKKAK
jgi:hypothetical protein